MVELQTALWVWQWGKQMAGESLPALAALPPTCKEALAHTALVCTGSTPSYFPSGWGPCCLCWGWLLLCALLGVAGSRASAMLSWRGTQRQRPCSPARARAGLPSCGGWRHSWSSYRGPLCHLLWEIAGGHVLSSNSTGSVATLARGAGARRRGGRTAPTEA